MMKRLNKKENLGITLIALVITIIILLILAGITITQLSNSGLFGKSQEAKERSENAIAKEETELAKYDNEINSYISGNRTTPVEDYTTNMIFKLNLNNLIGQTGVTINGTGVTVSNDNKYVSFDGNSSIEISNTVITENVGNDVTLCCWYRTDTPCNNAYGSDLLGFGDYRVNNVYNKHYLLIEQTSVGACQGYGTCTRIVDPKNFCDNNWHFMVGVWESGNKVTLYYDTVPFGNTGSYTQSNKYINIGGSPDLSQANYKGDISDIRVYNHALTESEVKQLYLYGKQYLEI